MKKLIVIKYAVGALLLCAVATLTSCGPTYLQQRSDYSSISKHQSKKTIKAEEMKKYESKKEYKTAKKETRKSQKKR